MKLHPKIGKPFRRLYSCFYLNPEERLWVIVVIVILSIGAIARWHHAQPQSTPISIEEKS